MWCFWLILSGIFFIIEIFTTGFLIFWLGIGALISMIISLFTSNIIIQTIVFVISSGLLILFTRPLINKFLKFNKSDSSSTNVYRLIGKKGFVIEEIKPLSPGQIKVEGEIWSAISDFEIPINTDVKIIDVDGVKLKVEPI